MTGASSAGEIPPFPDVQWHQWFGEVWSWLMALGQPLLIGLPVLALGLSLAGYLAVRLLWRGIVVWKWHRRTGK